MNKIHMGSQMMNTQRRFGEDPSFYPVLIKWPSGAEEVALFTPEQLHIARERGAKNPEDTQRWLLRARAVQRRQLAYWYGTLLAGVATLLILVEMGGWA